MASGETHEQTHDVAIDTSARHQQSQPESVASLWTPLSGAETSWLDASVRGTLGQGRGVQASRESMLLRMQATMSNTAVQRLVEQDTAGAARRAAIVIQRQPPGAPPADTDAGAAVKQDDEGNDISEDGGKPHLTKIPTAVSWHTGKPEALPPNPIAAYNGLKAQVQAVAAEQLATTESLKGDMKYWFAKVYYFVTLNELKAIEANAYQYPMMKMQEVISFQATYKQNLENWRAGKKDQVEANWQAAFNAAERSTIRTPGGWVLQVVSLGQVATKSSDILDSLLPSMEAHIRFDLPRAIASCYDTNYAGIPGLSMGDFRADFDKMEPVFTAAQANLQPEIDQYNSKEWGVDPGNWHWMQSLCFPFKFDIPMEREQAWEKASAIVDGHAQGITDQSQMQSRLEAYITGAHPFSGSDAFVVGDQMVVDYDWNHQPGAGPPPGEQK
jgi:Family of unknown function (DUF5995)